MNSKPLNILVVDDEPLIQKAFLLAAKSRGHHVELASNGLEALEIWDKAQPEILFLDVLMPKMDGFEFLKNMPTQPKPKIIMISAHNELNDLEIQQTGVDLFVKKPFQDIYLLIEQAENLAKK